MTIIDELTIKLKLQKDITASGSNNIIKSNKTKKHRVRPLNNDELDPSIASINIFPSNKIGKFIVKSILLIIPTLNLEFRQTTIISAFENKTYIEYLKFFARSRYSRKSNEKISLKFSILVNKIIHDIKTGGDIIKPFQLGSINFENKLLINYITGKIDDLRIRININDSDVLVFNAAKYYIFKDEIYKQQIVTEHRPIPTPEELEIKKNNRIQMVENGYRFVHAIISEVNIHIENSKLSEIPFVTMENNTDVKHYFNDSKPATCLELMTKSVSFNFSRMNKDAAGFEVLFNSQKDRPYHLTCSVQLLKVFYAARTTLPTGYLGQTSDEILNIPNVALTYKTNVLDQLVRSKGFKNCVIEVYFSASTPIFDLDTRQLSALLYNLILIKKWRRLHEFKDIIVNSPLSPEEFFPEDEQEYDEETAHDITNESFNLNGLQAVTQREPLTKKMYRYLNEFYPRLDIKLVIEQPRIVIRHYEAHKNTQILSFSYSLLNFSLFTTSTRDYASSCQVLNPKITYYEKSHVDLIEKQNFVLKKDITSMNYLDIKLDILKNLKIKTFIDFNKLTIDLTNLEIFTGIHYLLLDVTRMVETDLEIGVINKKFNQELLRLRHELKLRSLSTGSTAKKFKSSSIEDKLFKYLPSWLTKLDFKLSFLNLLLGSRSVLIPKQDLANSQGPEFDFDFDEQHELKQINFKIESLVLGVNNHGNKSGENSPTNSVSSSASLETLASINYDLMYWSINTKLDKLKLSALTDLHGKFSHLLEIPAIKSNINAICNYNGKNKIVVDLSMDKLNLDYNRYKFGTLIGCVYLIREFMISPIKLIKLKVRKDLTRFDSLMLSPTITPDSESILDYISFEFKLDYLDIILRLSDEFKVKLQLSDIQAFLRHKEIGADVGFIRGLADSPQVKDKWNRLLCLDKLKLRTNIPSSIKEFKIEIDTNSIRFIQPHQFVVYKLFDNISGTVKLVKHLIKLLKDESSKEQLNIVHPNLQKPKALPFISLKSKTLKFTMEDDPFEVELGMIYQLGLIEQRKRSELYTLFNDRAAVTKEDGEDYFNKLNHLHKTVSRSWIRKVKTYKAQLREEIISNKEYLFGGEVLLPESLNDDVVAYPYSPPLTAVYMDNLQLDLSKPKFELKKVADFVYKFGQGVPKDTEYTLLIPLYASLKLGELRMHLRDYPLPLVHSPRNKDIADTSFSLDGHLIITEAFINSPEHIRKINVPLVPQHYPELSLNKFDSLIVEKTLASVKMYTDLQCSFNSDYPTRIIWGTSYNFGIQQTMLNFDKFSKPPVDPSPKLGFWDKLKYVLHGKCTIKTKKSLEVGFKGSRDPYDLFCTAGGFVLSFKKNVIWDINKNDDSKNFFDVTSDKVSWYIPNYLEGPLMAWTRSSSEAIYLTESPHMISSLYGYYIGNRFGDTDFDSANNVVEKIVINLSGGVNFRLGFLLERKDNDHDDDDDAGKLTDKFKPHYDVHLYDPKYCKKNHDSYAGFRSQYINMAISLESNNESSYNTIHLSPGVFVQFFSWWKLFASNMQLPIRRGRMFDEPKQSVKFSQHLFSNKFSFIMKSLFIAHVYRDEIIDLNNDRVECVGLRGKVDELMIDLHQSKSFKKDEKSSSKMEFHIGEVLLSSIDLRVMHASFLQNIFNKSNSKKKNDFKPTYHIHDKDERWFDIEDFEEAYLTSVRNVKTIAIYPLMNLPRFSYERNTHDSGFDEGANKLGSTYGGFHKCCIGSNNPLQTRLKVLTDRLEALEEQLNEIYQSNETDTIKDLRKRILFLENEIGKVNRGLNSKLRRASTLSDLDKSEKFHNKFTFYSPQLIWNFNNRNCTLRYIHFVKLKSSMRKYLSYKSIQTLDKIMQRANDLLDATDELSSTSSISPIMRAFTRDGGSTSDRNSSSQQRIANFNSILREINQGEDLVEDYLIEILSPQIQLQSEDYEDSVVIVSAPSIKGKILSIIDSASSEGNNEVLLETRYGGLLQDANVFVLNKKDILGSSSMLTVNNPYGAKSNWPPWLGSEITQNGKWAGANNLLIEDLSVMVLVYESEILTKKDNDDISPLRFEVDIPSLVITSTSSQYFTLYVIILSLLFYSEPMSKVIQEKIKKMKFSIDFEDLGALIGKLTELQQYYRLLNTLSFNYSFRKDKLNNEELNNYLQLNLERGDIASDVFLLLKTLLTGDYATDSSDTLQMTWLIMADEIILQILEDDRTPIMNIALTKGIYKRKELESGSNINKVHIGQMRGFNLIENAKYPDFIEPLDKKSTDNIIELEWTMNKSVGGIKVVENVSVNASPLNIKIDEITGEKLMSFIFHTNSGDDVKDSKIIAIANERKEDEVTKDSNDQDGKNEQYGLVSQNEGANKGFDLEKQQQEEELELQQQQQGEEEVSQSRSLASKSKRNLTLLSVSGKSIGNGNSSSSNNDLIDEDKDIKIMVERSKKYFSVVSLFIQAISLQVTLKLNKGFKRVLNVYDLKIHLPEWNIRNEILSFMDVTKMIQKEITKIILSHIGRLIANKFTYTKEKSRKKLTKRSTVQTISDVRQVMDDTNTSQITK